MLPRLWLLLVVLVAACDGGDSLAGFGEACTTGHECADGVCFQGSCTSACRGNADCQPGYACGTEANGNRTCMTACTLDTFPGFGCVDGAPVACERAGDDAPCSQCGCNAVDYCPPEPGATCQPLAAEGEDCASNDRCASGNCSVHDGSGQGTCLKAHGAACTPGDASCLSCDATASGNVCAQGCDAGDGCGGGQLCIGDAGSGYFCRQSCAGSARCPAYWSCNQVGVDRAYCDPPRRCDPSRSGSCGLLETCHPELGLCYKPF